MDERCHFSVIFPREYIITDISYLSVGFKKKVFVSA